jgi:hypothetical protein
MNPTVEHTLSDLKGTQLQTIENVQVDIAENYQKYNKFNPNMIMLALTK